MTRAVVGAVTAADVADTIVGTVAAADMADGVVGSVAGERDGRSGDCEGEEDAGRCGELVDLHGNLLVREGVLPGSRRPGRGRKWTLVLRPRGFRRASQGLSPLRLARPRALGDLGDRRGGGAAGHELERLAVVLDRDGLAFEQRVRRLVLRHVHLEAAPAEDEAEPQPREP